MDCGGIVEVASMTNTERSLAVHWKALAARCLVCPTEALRNPPGHAVFASHMDVLQAALRSQATHALSQFFLTSASEEFRYLQLCTMVVLLIVCRPIPTALSYELIEGLVRHGCAMVHDATSVRGCLNLLKIACPSLDEIIEQKQAIVPDTKKKRGKHRK